MDALRIERAALLPTPPTYGLLGSRSKREKTDGADEAAARPGETSEPGKPEKASTTQETAIRISYDKDIGRIVFQLLDKKSATVVRQLPSEEVVAFLKQFRKAMTQLVDTTI
jgi:uncharacterized FlaG/YvyC family protein